MTEPILLNPLTGTIPKAVCLGCGCACDDVILSLDGVVLKDFSPRCNLGREWFERGLSDHAVLGHDSNASVMSELAKSLREARSPVIFGLTQCSTETVRAALELADRVGARLILNRKDSDVARASAFQNVGRVTATLGEVKNRADLVIYWGCDPSTTHPRHGERYSSKPVGRFLPGGRGDRTIVVIGSAASDSSESADEFIRLDPDRTLEFVALARLLLRGKPLPPEAVFDGLGFSQSTLDGFLERCRGARYGALFFQPPPGSGAYGRIVWEALISLVRDLNDLTRFVVMGLGSSGNLQGAEAALTWQTGQLIGVDYRLGFPESLHDDASLNHCLESSELDLLVVVADQLPADLTASARENLSRVPCYVIAPRASWDRRVSYRGTVATARFGIDSGGTVTRSDGVAVPVRPVLASGLLSEKFFIDTLIKTIDVGPARSESP